MRYHSLAPYSVDWMNSSPSSSICFFLACASASFFSCSSFLILSSSALFWAACFFSCSARISFLAACLSFNLELCLLLGALVPPLTDVLPQLVVHLGLLLLVFGRRHGDE